jgi:arylsulfatase A-like enzyme
MRNLIAIRVLIVVAGFLPACKNNTPQVSEKKPNIIFILTDDQRWDALGFASNSIIKTPYMDKLAGSGLYFKNAFVTTSICAASRAALFTGLYERTHNYTFGQPPLDNQYMFESYPYLLKKAGYKTGFVGKFGVKVNEGIRDSLFDWRKETAWPYIKEIDGKKVHLADIEGDFAIDFIKSSKDQPFCLSLSFWAPHADDGAKEQYFWPDYCDSLYKDVVIPLPETADPAFFEALPDFLKTTMNRERWYWRFDNPEKYQHMVKGYYKMISCVDSVIGRIQNILTKEGLAENTVIIFMGDNGYFLGDRGYADKWLMYEQSIRVPMIIYDPRQPETRRGKIFDEMVLNIDVTPTILQLAGIQSTERYQGSDLTAFYEKKPENWRTGIFCEHWLEKNSTILKTECYRDDTWKFIRYLDHPDFVELYNFKEDVNEIHNLALDKNYTDKIEFYKQKCDSAIARLISDRVGNLN